MRFEDSIALIEANLPKHPLIMEAWNVVKSYAFNHYILSGPKGASSPTHRDSLGGLLGYEKDK